MISNVVIGQYWPSCSTEIAFNRQKNQISDDLFFDFEFMTQRCD